MVQQHFLVVTFPAQGHINPGLQFAKRLLNSGVSVTFATSVYAHRNITKTTVPKDVTLATFSDGYDDGFKSGDDAEQYMLAIRRNGSKTLTDLMKVSAKEGRPFTCLVYTLLLPWAAEVARELHVPSTLLWIQPAAVLDIYYYYFKGLLDVKMENINDPSWSIQLPGLPLMTGRDLPSFINPKNTYSFGLPSFKEQIEALEAETNPKILVNTFDALEPDALRAIDNFNLVAIGPLIPSAYLDEKYPSDTSFGGDLFESYVDYIQFLDSKSKQSVVYISFGSISVLSRKQKEEIAVGLLESRRPFLWVIRSRRDGEEEEKEEDELSCKAELEQQGMIVPWCSQLEVLSHLSLGCFLTHCGWNSTMESLVIGIPVISFPQWTDQGTNAKLIQDVWKMGVRVKSNEEGIVEGGEITRCLDLVMGDGEEGKEMRRNAKKWKELAKEAVMEGGSSVKNLNAFIDGVREGC